MRITLSVMLISVLLVIGLGTWFVRRPWPQVSGTLAVAGLTAPVEVLRDRWGVPHIYAQNEQDLFFAQGYTHAQDRLWQMEFNRRVGSGTLSAAIGQPTVAIDRQIRTMGLRRAAQHEWESLDGETRAILEAYAAGVTAYIASHQDRLPLEFTILGVTPEPWSPIDTLTWSKVMSLNLSGNYRQELLRIQVANQFGTEVAQTLLPPYADGTPLDIPPELADWEQARLPVEEPAVAALMSGQDQRQGSNNWVVHGSLTESGLPLLANDTHLDLGMPSIWYENGLHGGRFDSVGFTFPGTPLVVLGHNSQIAWGVTALPADVQDLYVEKLNHPTNPTQYEFRGQWRDLTITQEVIAVKNSSPITLEVRRTHHGPIVDEQRQVALRWPIGTNSLLRSLAQVNLANDWDSFRQALRFWDLPNQHFVYADVEGNIGYQSAGVLPIRAPQHQGLVPVPGWTGEYEWQGLVPADRLLSVLNPPAGMVATSNDRVVTADNPQYTAYGYEWPEYYRTDLITSTLTGHEPISLEDMRDVQADTYSQPAESLVPYLASIQPADELQTAALAQLTRWDRRFTADQPGGAIFQVWYSFLVRNTFGDELGNDLVRQYQNYSWMHMKVLLSLMPDANNPWFDDTSTTPVETRDAMVQRSFADAVAWLSTNHGQDPAQWQWGKIHTVTMVHQPLGRSGIALLDGLFNSRTMPSQGGEFVINNSWLHPRTFKRQGGTVQRLLIDVGDWDNTRAINSSGQNGQLWHPHRDDMIAMWERVEYHALPFTRARVEAAAETTLTLTPP